MKGRIKDDGGLLVGLFQLAGGDRESEDDAKLSAADAPAMFSCATNGAKT